ncbi:MAG: single-stranded DNA-binding protein [Candidatus Melainabacteria bacterium]|nr:single-stranded DNA-binding protein [Candidatus Melainabacteria bacterium]MBI3307789.1 single-stranded DNA-binding protein [Candidatus Melainabacteria bacterium]
MSAQNQVTLIGRLTRDPEVDEVGKTKKYLRARLSLAVRKYKRKRVNDQNDQPDADFIDGIIAWSKQAEFARDYLTKGRMIVVYGELMPDRWKDKENKNRYRLTIIASSIQSLDSKKKAD